MRELRKRQRGDGVAALLTGLWMRRLHARSVNSTYRGSPINFWGRIGGEGSPRHGRVRARSTARRPARPLRSRSSPPGQARSVGTATVAVMVAQPSTWSCGSRAFRSERRSTTWSDPVQGGLTPGGRRSQSHRWIVCLGGMRCAPWPATPRRRLTGSSPGRVVPSRGGFKLAGTTSRRFGSTALAVTLGPRVCLALPGSPSTAPGLSFRRSSVARSSTCSSGRSGRMRTRAGETRRGGWSRLLALGGCGRSRLSAGPEVRWWSVRG